ncbi:MAG TPA: sulfatase-like hydrolase/transferase, partial [Victivallales bacterium]|nr:sulfatase-like hydrolase/transferase [Victivallales bacterium]
MNSPNIIFFFTDQQRWDTCGCYGQKLNITPNLDKMAQEGILFENAFTCQPVCGPARACLQTGKYPSETGNHTNHTLLPLNEDTIAKILRRNGYEVGYIGKWHLASFGPIGGPDDFRIKPVPIERRGGYLDYWLASDVLEFTSHSYDGYMFDSDGNKRFFPEGRYRADAITDWALEYLETRKLSKPFFLFLSYIEPHHQNDHNCYEGPKGSKDLFKNFEIPGDLLGTEGDWRQNYPDYLGCCNSLDNNLGRIREKLEKLGIAENTILIFTSDHGSHFRTRNSEYKRSCHDGCTHIPLVIYGPEFKGGKRFHEMVSLIDIPPTILACGNIKKTDYMRGNPLQMLIHGTETKWPDDVYIQISESHTGRAIRTHKWKYSVR